MLSPERLQIKLSSLVLSAAEQSALKETGVYLGPAEGREVRTAQYRKFWEPGEAANSPPTLRPRVKPAHTFVSVAANRVIAQGRTPLPVDTAGLVSHSTP